MPGHVSLLSAPGALRQTLCAGRSLGLPGRSVLGVPAAGRGRWSPAEPSATAQSCAPAVGRAAARGCAGICDSLAVEVTALHRV